MFIKSDSLGKNILIKYLCKELLYYFFICFSFLFVIFFVNQILLIGEDLLSQRAPIKDVALIMLYSLPSIVAQSAPYATLVGFLMCLGRMNSDNEILIFRASGLSFKSILAPILALGLLISIFSFFVNDYLLPLGTIKYSEMYRKIMRSNPTVVLEPNSVKNIDNSLVVIGDVSNNQVSDVVFFDTDGRNESIIIAQNSVLTPAKSDGVLLQLDMNNSLVFKFDRNDLDTYEYIKAGNLKLNIFDSIVSGHGIISPRELTYKDLKAEIRGMHNEDDEVLNVWKMELYKKIAVPFSALFFSFLAYSIAFLFGKHNGLTMGVFVGIIICVLYWALQLSGQLLVLKVNYNVFACIWIPNILIGVIGLLLSIRLIRK